MRLRRFWLIITYHWKQLSVQKLVSIAGFSLIFMSALVIMSGVVSPGKDLDRISTAARPASMQNGILYRDAQSNSIFEKPIIYKPVVLEGGEGIQVFILYYVALDLFLSHYCFFQGLLLYPPNFALTRSSHANFIGLETLKMVVGLKLRSFAPLLYAKECLCV